MFSSADYSQYTVSYILPSFSYMSHVVYTSFSHLSIVIKSKVGTVSKRWDTKPIRYLNIGTFGIEVYPMFEC